MAIFAGANKGYVCMKVCVPVVICNVKPKRNIFLHSLICSTTRLRVTIKIREKNCLFIIYLYLKPLSKNCRFFPWWLFSQENKFQKLKESHLSKKLFNCYNLEMPPWSAGFILVTFHLYSWLQFLWVWLVNFFHTKSLPYINNCIKLNLAAKSIQSTKFFSWWRFRIVLVSHYVGLSFFSFVLFFLFQMISLLEDVHFLHSRQNLDISDTETGLRRSQSKWK